MTDCFRTCPNCGGKLKMRDTQRGMGWRLTSQVCQDKCGFRQICETRIVRTAIGRFRRGEGFAAQVKRLLGR